MSAATRSSSRRRLRRRSRAGRAALAGRPGAARRHWYGAEHELVIYPREGHGLVERNHQLDLLRRTRAWFDRWLRDEVSDG
jgi:hypothetical protein